jgi:hypothetical protein
LRLELKPSPLLAIAIIAAHAAAAACAAAAMPGIGAVPVAAALLALGAMAAARRALLKTRGSVRALELEGHALTVCLADGRHLAAEVAARRYVSRFIVILPLRRPVRGTILVTRDMVAGDAFRRLRVWALWGRLPAISGPSGAVAAKQLSA